MTAALPFAKSGLERWGKGRAKPEERSCPSLETARIRRFQVAHSPVKFTGECPG